MNNETQEENPTIKLATYIAKKLRENKDNQIAKDNDDDILVVNTKEEDYKENIVKWNSEGRRGRRGHVFIHRGVDRNNRPLKDRTIATKAIKTVLANENVSVYGVDDL